MVNDTFYDVGSKNNNYPYLPSDPHQILHILLADTEPRLGKHTLVRRTHTVVAVVAVEAPQFVPGIEFDEDDQSDRMISQYGGTEITDGLYKPLPAVSFQPHVLPSSQWPYLSVSRIRLSSLVDRSMLAWTMDQQFPALVVYLRRRTNDVAARSSREV